MNAEQARTILKTHGSTCAGVDCIEARAYLAALEGPEVKAFESGIDQALNLGNSSDAERVLSAFRKARFKGESS